MRRRAEAGAGRGARVVLLCVLLGCTATVPPGRLRGGDECVRDRAGGRTPCAAVPALRRLRGGADEAGEETGGTVGIGQVGGTPGRGRVKTEGANGERTGVRRAAGVAERKRSLSRMMREEEDRRLRQVCLRAARSHARAQPSAARMAAARACPRCSHGARPRRRLVS